MRWNNKDRPEIGDSRWVNRFFFFPECFNGVWIWMEWGDVYQEYVESYIYEFGGAIPNHQWRNIGLANL